VPPLESGAAVAAATSSQPAIINPTEAIKTHAMQFDRLYASYNALRNLAKPLNGLQQSDSIPDNVKIRSIKIDYVVNDTDGMAEITTVNFVGELAPLIGPALKNLIADIRVELDRLDSVTTAVKAAVGSVSTTNVTAQLNTSQTCQND
jgi:hypothetical protein